MKKTLAEMVSKASGGKALENVQRLFDIGTFVETDRFVSASGEIGSVITGYGLIGGRNVYVFAQNPDVASGGLTESSARKISKLLTRAAQNGSPVVGIYDSKGGVITEGARLLHAYGELTAAAASLLGVVPVVSVITGTCGGSGAVLSQLSDFVIMTEKAELFVTPPFLAVDTKAGAATAASAAKTGGASIVAKDAGAAIAKARELISVLPDNNLEPAIFDYVGGDSVSTAAGVFGQLQDSDVPTIEILAGFATNVQTSFGSVGGVTAAFITTNKNDVAEVLLTPDDLKKILRFVRFADAYTIPVITEIDVYGLANSTAAEYDGAVRVAAKLTSVYAAATTPKLALIKNAVGVGFTVLGAFGADYAAALESAVIAPVSPKAAAVLLSSDKIKDGSNAALEAVASEYAENEGNPFAAAALGLIDSVVSVGEAAEQLRAALAITGGKRASAAQPRKGITI